MSHRNLFYMQSSHHLHTILVLLACLVFQHISAQTHIMPLGNSITQGENGFISYREPLWDLIQTNGINADFVGSHSNLFQCNIPGGFDIDHEGHWDWRINEILDGSGNTNNCASQTPPGEGLADWLTSYTPDIALVHLGTNDLLHDNQPPVDLILELEQVIDTLREDNPNIAIFVATLIPSTDITLTNRIIAYNPLMPALVADKDTSTSPVFLVDQFAGYDPAVDNYDPYHPDSSGREKVAQKWFQAIQDYLNPTFPVSWGHFSAQTQGSTVHLNWQTLEEKNSQGFTVQYRPEEVGAFQPLGFVPSSGNSESVNQYNFQSETLPPGRYVFRLQHMDLDGSIQHSNTRIAEISQPQTAMLVYPNPSQNWVHVHISHFDGVNSLQWKLLDAMGRPAAQGLEHNPAEEISISTANLPSGIYHVQVQMPGGKLMQERVVVQR